jgi:hypothetical protein
MYPLRHAEDRAHPADMAQPCDGDPGWLLRYRRWGKAGRPTTQGEGAGGALRRLTDIRLHRGETKLLENRWALHVACAAASRGKVNLVADATLSPTDARAYARSILAAADDADRQGGAAATTDRA